MHVPSELLKKIINSLKKDDINISAAEILINDSADDNILNIKIDDYDINYLIKLLELCNIDLEIFENNKKKMKDIL